MMPHPENHVEAASADRRRGCSRVMDHFKRAA